MKLLIVLPISTLTDEKNKTLEKREKRVKQICEGLSKLFSFKCFSNFLLDKTNELSFVLSDNTVNNISDKILNIIPFKKYNIMLYASKLNNKYGCKNKGAGLIEHWRYMKEAIKSFDWIIHFEPRMLLKSEKFFTNSVSPAPTKEACFRSGISSKIFLKPSSSNLDPDETL